MKTIARFLDNCLYFFICAVVGLVIAFMAAAPFIVGFAVLDAMMRR